MCHGLQIRWGPEPFPLLHCWLWTKEEEEQVCVRNWMGPRDRGQPGGVTLCQAADAGVKLKPPPTPARGIPAGSCPVGVVQKWVRTSAANASPWGKPCRCTRWVPRSPHKPGAFPRAAGTHLGLESHVTCFMWGLQAGSGCGAGRFSPMCFHCRCWQVWKLHIACKPFDGHSPLRPNKTVPLPRALSV